MTDFKVRICDDDKHEFRVTIPETNAPLVPNIGAEYYDQDEFERDWGNAEWPSDTEVLEALKAYGVKASRVKFVDPITGDECLYRWEE